MRANKSSGRISGSFFPLISVLYKRLKIRELYEISPKNFFSFFFFFFFLKYHGILTRGCMCGTCVFFQGLTKDVPKDGHSSWKAWRGRSLKWWAMGLSLSCFLFVCWSLKGLIKCSSQLFLRDFLFSFLDLLGKIISMYL